MYLYNFNPCCSGQWSSTNKAIEVDLTAMVS